MRIFEVNYTRLVAFFTASRWFTNASKQNILDSGNMSDCTIFLESMHVYQVHLMPEFQRLSPSAFMQSFLSAAKPSDQRLLDVVLVVVVVVVDYFESPMYSF